MSDDYENSAVGYGNSLSLRDAVPSSCSQNMPECARTCHTGRELQASTTHSEHNEECIWSSGHSVSVSGADYGASSQHALERPGNVSRTWTMTTSSTNSEHNENSVVGS